VIEGGEFYALHRGEKLPLPFQPGPALAEYLEKAAALDPQPSPLLPLIDNVKKQQQPAATSN
jgi:hypothetical protein